MNKENPEKMASGFFALFLRYTKSIPFCSLIQEPMALDIYICLS